MGRRASSPPAPPSEEEIAREIAAAADEETGVRVLYVGTVTPYAWEEIKARYARMGYVPSQEWVVFVKEGGDKTATKA
jgi:hypothetical protein